MRRSAKCGRRRLRRRTLGSSFGLEDRITPAVAIDALGNLVIDGDDGQANDVRISVSGTNDYVISDSGPLSHSIRSAFGREKTSISIPIGLVTGSHIYVNTGDGDDTFTIDFGGGNFAHKIVYDGGDDFDDLVLTGGSFDTITHDYVNSHSGSITADANSIAYSHIEPIDQTGTTAGHLVFNLPAAASNVTLGDDGTPGNGISRISSSPATFETTTFANPTNSLTINRGHAADVLTIAALPDFNRTLTVGTSANPLATVNFTAGLNVGANTVSLSAHSIRPTFAGTDVIGRLTFGAGSDLVFSITDSTTYDRLTVGGTVDLTGVDLVLSGSYPTLLGDSLNLVSVPGIGQDISGTFNGLAHGNAVAFSGETLYVSYSPTVVSLARHRVLFPAAGPQDSASLGQSVAVSDRYRVVGAPESDVFAYSSIGQVFVYDSMDNRLITLNYPGSLFPGGRYFGSSVAVSEQLVAVGAHGGDAGSSHAGSAYIFDAATGALLHTLNNPTPASNDNFGYSLAMSGNFVVVGAYQDDTGAQDAGSAYVFDATSGALLHTINNPTPAFQDRFGASVAVSGNFVAVGAPLFDDTGVGNAGSAYVFDATTGALLHTLNNPTPAEGENFGESVALSGSFVVVGAPGEDSGAEFAGSAYVFNAATGTLMHTLNNPTPAQFDAFGWSVAAAGTLVVVGAQKDDTGASSAGSAYVFNVTTGALLHTINNSAPAAHDNFGSSVAVSGNTVIVGAYRDDVGATDTGAAYTYDATTGTLLHSLDNLTLETEVAFGGSVAASENFIVVGAYQDDAGASNAGSAYVFSATTGAMLHTLHNPTPAEGDQFGYSVAASGNFIVVGAYADNTGGSDAGSAYLFDATTGVLLRTLNNPTPAAGDWFGGSVAISGNFVVVGATRDDTGASNAGSAYVFNATTGALLHTLNNPTPAVDDEFGVSVAVSGNLIVVGAYQDNTVVNNVGSAYVYDATTGALLRTLNNPTPAVSDYFGISVAASGDFVIVGAVGNDNNTGSAYVFNGSTGALLYTLNNPTPAGFDEFGSSVAVSENFVVVGAYQDDIGEINSGAAYVFDAATGTLLHTLNNPTPGVFDGFGKSVAATPSFAVVGAYQDSSLNYRQGAVYVYPLSPAAPAPSVTDVRIGNGINSIQRSRVTQIVVAFDQVINYVGAPTAAYTLQRIVGGVPTGSPVNISVSTVTVGTHSEATITFNDNLQFGSLTDGRYRLTVNAGQVPGMATNHVVNFHRFYGDINGDTRVDGGDFVGFVSTYGLLPANPAFIAAFDFNGDGRIDGADFGQFVLRYGQPLP